ncbi:putative maltokinase [Pendulispora rubella]|uniref:Maltokinase n=1 Tax=Pendulispora rubella TaxID=2741070 RepID=A0ABZ2LD90_9BACT
MNNVDPNLSGVEAALASYVAARRWFRGKARSIAKATLRETIPLPIDSGRAWIGLVDITYADGATDEYTLPMMTVDAERAAVIRRERPHLLVRDCADGGAVVDALGDTRVLRALLPLIGRDAVLEHDGSVVRFRRGTRTIEALDAEPRPVDVEQSNTSVVYGQSYILKVIRKLDAGVSADLEMGEFLTQAGYAHAPAVAGAIDLARGGAEPATLGILHRFVPNRGDAWAFFLGRLAQVAERPPAPGADPLGDDRARVRLLATRVAEMHVALASRSDLAAFAPEPITRDEREHMAEAVRHSLRAVFAELTGKRSGSLPADAVSLVAVLAARARDFEIRLNRFVEREMAAWKTRVHGDLHLGQVLVSDDDFVIIDFEGEPLRPLSERKAKRSPLADVAGLLRSLHYATVTAARARGTPEARGALQAWHVESSRELQRAYFAGTREQSFQTAAGDVQAMLDFYALEKCTYEVLYELNNRPDWVAIPLAGLTEWIERTDAP